MFPCDVFRALIKAVRGAQWVKRPTKKPGAVLVDARSSPRCGKGFFSQSQLPVQTLLRCLYSPRCGKGFFSQSQLPVQTLLRCLYSPRCGKEFFSQSQLPVQTLLRCSYSPRVQSLASTCVSTLNIPNWQPHHCVTKTVSQPQTVGLVNESVLAGLA